MPFFTAAVKREVVVMHEGIRFEHLVLPIGLLRTIVKTVRISRRLDHGEIIRFGIIDRHPVVESVFHIVCQLSGTVFHGVDTQFGERKILTGHQVQFFPSVLNTPVCIKTDIDLTFATGLGRDQNHTVRTTATVDSGGRSVLEDLH